MRRASRRSLTALAGNSGLFVCKVTLTTNANVCTNLSTLFNTKLSKFPSFSVIRLREGSCLLVVLCVLYNLVLTCFCRTARGLAKGVSGEFPTIIQRVFTNLYLKVTNSFLPTLVFSKRRRVKALVGACASCLPLTLVNVTFFGLLLAGLYVRFNLGKKRFFPIVFTKMYVKCNVTVLAYKPSKKRIMFKTTVIATSLLNKVVGGPLTMAVLLFLYFPIGVFV